MLVDFLQRHPRAVVGKGQCTFRHVGQDVYPWVLEAGVEFLPDHARVVSIEEYFAQDHFGLRKIPFLKTCSSASTSTFRECWLIIQLSCFVRQMKMGQLGACYLKLFKESCRASSLKAVSGSYSMWLR